MTSWESEYLKILERLESAPGMVQFSYSDDERMGGLLKELHDASLISGTFYIGPLADVAITYNGRLELDRLRQKIWWRRTFAWLGSAFLLVVGYIANIIRDIVVNVCSTN